jgi:hypothetical protein
VQGPYREGNVDDFEKTAYLDEWFGKVLGTESRPPGATEFVGIIEAKLDFGTRKYGPGSWKRHDMWGELLTELVDTFNYPYLAWRVMRELGVDKSQPQLFLRIEGALRKMALESFNNWATLTRLVATLDALNIPRSVSGEDRVGVQTTMEAVTDDRTDNAEAAAGAGGSSDGGPAAVDDGPGEPGTDRGDVEVRAGSDGPAAGTGPGHEAPRVRHRSGAS